MLAVAAATMLVLAACGGTPEVVQDPSPQPVRTIDQPAAATSAATPDVAAEAVGQYMRALAGNDPAAMREALKVTVEGSAANAYLRFHIAQREAMLDAGLSLRDAPQDLSRNDGGYQLCNDQRCTMFDAFTADGHLLADLHVDGQSPGPRLVLGNGRTVDSNGVSAELIVAYQSIDPPDSLVVLLRMQTDGVTASPFLYSSVYRAPDGAQREATDAWAPTELGVDSHATVGILFEQVEPGGQVTIDGCVRDCDGDFTITMQVG